MIVMMAHSKVHLEQEQQYAQCDKGQKCYHQHECSLPSRDYVLQYHTKQTSNQSAANASLQPSNFKL